MIVSKRSTYSNMVIYWDSSFSLWYCYALPETSLLIKESHQYYVKPLSLPYCERRWEKSVRLLEEA